MSYQTFDCEIETITPIHIGSGKNYSRAEYLIDKNRPRFIRVDLAGFYASLKENQQKDFNNFSKYNRLEFHEPRNHLQTNINLLEIIQII